MGKNIPWNLPTNFHSDLIATIRQRTMIPGKIFTSFAKLQGIVSVNDFRFRIWLQELLQAPLCFLRSFVLHGYDWIHWVAKSCTTTANRWLFRDSQPSLRTLWSAVIKSPKFSARSTAPPLRLLHGALVIFGPLTDVAISVFREMSLTLCLPKSSLLLDVGSKDFSWEELAWESLLSRTLSSTRFSLNSCSHSGMSEHNGAGLAANNGSLRSIVDSSLFGFCFFWLAWQRYQDWQQTTGLSSLSFLQHLNLTQALDGNRSHLDLPFLESHCRLTQLWLVK